MLENYFSAKPITIPNAMKTVARSYRLIWFIAFMGFS